MNLALLHEASPPGFSGTVKAMKKKMPESKAFAIAWSQYKKGAKPHKKPEKHPKGVKNYVKPSKYFKGRKKKKIDENYDWTKPMDTKIYDLVPKPGDTLEVLIKQSMDFISQGYKAVRFEFGGKQYYIDQDRYQNSMDALTSILTSRPPGKKIHLGSAF